jgi:carboxyl-terminal processing protease
MTNSNISTISESVESILREKLFHPRVRGKALDDLITSVVSQCQQGSSGDISTDINDALKGLDVSNTAFWRTTPCRPVAAQWMINATVQMFVDNTREVWLFKDVLAGGIAARAGISPGDELIAVNGVPVDKEPLFRFGKAYKLTISEPLKGAQREVSIDLPAMGPKNRPPMTEPEALSSTIVKPGVGLLRVSAFPAIIGFDFARQLNGLLDMFKRERCSRLIVDLRANCGGGLGSLRLMSLFTPGRLEVGYSLSKRELDDNPASLPVINRIPHTRLGLYLMALRFRVFHRGRSLKLVTEGLGTLPFHGNIAILTNESSRSGAEMVAAFAQRNRLAKLVGTKTPGETLGAANFKVQDTYRLRIPLVGWFLPNGDVLERKGVSPDLTVTPTLGGLRSGKDEVLNEALAILA